MDTLIQGDTNILSTVIEIINSLCSNLFSSIDKNIFPLLDELVFIDKQILNTGDKMNKLLSTSPTKGILLLANTLFTAFVLYYAVRLIVSQLTGANIESPSKFFMRAFLSGISANFSIQICSFMISSISLISTFFCALGKNIFCYTNINAFRYFNEFFWCFFFRRYTFWNAFNLFFCSNNKFCI